MTIKIAINGYGQIGQNIVCTIFESRQQKQFDIVAINDLGDSEINAHLTQYDSVHGRFNGDVQVDGKDLVINGHPLTIFLNEIQQNYLERIRGGCHIRMHRCLLNEREC